MPAESSPGEAAPDTAGPGKPAGEAVDGGWPGLPEVIPLLDVGERYANVTFGLSLTGNSRFVISGGPGASGVQNPITELSTYGSPGGYSCVTHNRHTLV